MNAYTDKKPLFRGIPASQNIVAQEQMPIVSLFTIPGAMAVTDFSFLLCYVRRTTITISIERSPQSGLTMRCNKLDIDRNKADGNLEGLKLTSKAQS